MAKELLNHEAVRRQFISDVLGIPMDEIKSVRIRNPFLGRNHKGQKQGILDVLLELNNDTKIDVEVQVRPQKFWNKRSLFYLAKMYTDELFVGQDYEKLKKCVSINILNFNLLEGTANHSVYTLRDAKNRELTDLMEIHTIELKKQLSEDSPVDDWIRLFNATDDGEFAMIKRRTPGMLEAMEVVRQMSLRKRIKWEFEQRQKARRDRHSEDEYVREQGRIEGRQEGRQEQALLVYHNCLKRGMSEEEAIAISGVKQERDATK